MFNLFHKVPESKIIKNLVYIPEHHLYDGDTYLDRFDEMVSVSISKANVSYGERCIEYIRYEMFEGLWDELYEGLCNYRNASSRFKNEPVIEGEEILRHIDMITIYISRPKEDTIGFVLAGGCDWDEEYGFAVVINDEEIRYVGRFDQFLDPWGEMPEMGNYKAR